MYPCRDGRNCPCFPDADHRPLPEQRIARYANCACQAGDIEAALDQCERTEERWKFAELLRVKGELLPLQSGSSAAATAEDDFRQALDWAHRQGALSWELRAATSLAQLLRDQGRSNDALALLQPVYNRFTEGFDTVDLQAAKALIDALQ